MVAIALIGALVVPALGGDCYAAARDIPGGTTLSARDVAVVPCAARAMPAGLRYDRRSGTLTAIEMLPFGTYLGRLAALPEVQVAKGQVLTLRATSGPVAIEREVVALQSGRPGGRIFVRDAAGQVFSVRVGSIVP